VLWHRRPADVLDVMGDAEVFGRFLGFTSV
jgi:hypothetical protein